MEGPIQWRSLQRDLRGFEIIGVERQIDGLHRLHKSRLSKDFVSRLLVTISFLIIFSRSWFVRWCFFFFFWKDFLLVFYPVTNLYVTFFFYCFALVYLFVVYMYIYIICYFHCSVY
jgi:hypothetical protein